MNTIKDIKNPGFFTVNLGQLQIGVFTDGESIVENIQPMFAPKINKDLVADFLADNFLSSDKITLAGNVLLVKSEQKTILIDTGSGPNLSPSNGKLLESLLSAGLEPDKITDVVLTHAHPDHIGGIINKDGSLAFPNADIYIAKEEYDFWMAEEPDFSKGTKDAIADFEIQFAKQHLDLIQTKLQFYQDQDILFECLKLDSAPGHTPGHTIITVFSEREELLHTADTFQHILLVAHPEWGNQIDSDFELAIKTRKQILEKLSETKQLFFGDHLPFPGLGFIQKINEDFRYVPKSFYTV